MEGRRDEGWFGQYRSLTRQSARVIEYGAVRRNCGVNFCIGCVHIVSQCGVHGASRLVLERTVVRVEDNITMIRWGSVGVRHVVIPLDQNRMAVILLARRAGSLNA